LGRTWLIARLAGSIEIARHQKRRLREILALSEEKLIAGLGGVRAASISEEFERLDVDVLREAVDRAGLAAACRHDPAYPARLGDLEDAPAVVFVAGGLARLEALAGGDLEQGPRAAAVVGTRRASPDGLEVARALGRGMACRRRDRGQRHGPRRRQRRPCGGAGIERADGGGPGGRGRCPVSAEQGTPAPAHRRARVRGGRAAAGVRRAALVLPARNRIIAALAHTTIVVEAARRSGSLITAEIAADLGRDVGAVPGPVTAWRAAGTNALLRDGATVIRDAADALDVAVGVERHEAAVLHLEPRLRALLGAGRRRARHPLRAGRGAVRGRAHAGRPHRARAARPPAPCGGRALRGGPAVT
jgi:DNA processing protein